MGFDDFHGLAAGAVLGAAAGGWVAAKIAGPGWVAVAALAALVSGLFFWPFYGVIAGVAAEAGQAGNAPLLAGLMAGGSAFALVATLGVLSALWRAAKGRGRDHG